MHLRRSNFVKSIILGECEYYVSIGTMTCAIYPCISVYDGC